MFAVTWYISLTLGEKNYTYIMRLEVALLEYFRDAPHTFDNLSLCIQNSDKLNT